MPSLKAAPQRPRTGPPALWKIFARTAWVCAIIGALVFGLALKKIEPLPLSLKPLHFEAPRAYEWMRRLSKDFPDRVTWSDSRKRAAVWLRGELKKLGYEPQGAQFSEVIAGQQYLDLENIYALKRGVSKPDEIIAVVAHYDVAERTHEGAMDDASGVGTVLELARVFARQKTDRSILFLLTDSEEFGAFWGARSFVQSFPGARDIVAAINFDFISPEKQTRVLTLTDGLKQGYTPLWLRELALDSLRSLGSVKVMEMNHVVEFIQRAIQIPAADHGAFLAAGIPSFNWVGQTENFGHIMGHYHHTEYDVAEALQVESFEPFGKGAERLIYSIDALSRLPSDFRESSYWKLTSRLYIDGWVTTILHILAFIPFLIFSVVKFRDVLRQYTRSRVLLVLKNEAKSAAIVLASLLIGYVILLLLPTFRIITQYEAFPATQKSAILYSPNFLAILGVIAAVLVTYALFQKLFKERVDALGYHEIRQSLHAAFLTVIIAAAIAKNSYLAVLLLLPPAYFWMAIRTRGKPEDRVLNGFLVLGGAITLVTVAIVMSSIFYVGAVYWYVFLSAAYGLISAYTVVLFFMALTVMIRLFRSFVI